MPESTKAIEWEQKGDVTLVRFRGSMVTESENLGQAFQELKALAGKIGGKVILSLANVEFISSAGISALVWLSENLRAKRGQLIVCDVRPSVLKVFRVGRLDEIVEFHKTEAEAMAEFQLDREESEDEGKADKSERK